MEPSVDHSESALSASVALVRALRPFPSLPTSQILLVPPLNVVSTPPGLGWDSNTICGGPPPPAQPVNQGAAVRTRIESEDDREVIGPPSTGCSAAPLVR